MVNGASPFAIPANLCGYGDNARALGVPGVGGPGGRGRRGRAGRGVQGDRQGARIAHRSYLFDFIEQRLVLVFFSQRTPQPAFGPLSSAPSSGSRRPRGAHAPRPGQRSRQAPCPLRPLPQLHRKAGHTGHGACMLA